jgi:hypothetical protein
MFVFDGANKEKNCYCATKMFSNIEIKKSVKALYVDGWRDGRI